MVWDLRRALLKKEEFESARLAAFEFKHRARTWQLVAERLGLDPPEFKSLTARMTDEALLDEVRRRAPERHDVDKIIAECRAHVRKQLIAELGDPSPHRLA